MKTFIGSLFVFAAIASASPAFAQANPGPQVPTGIQVSLPVEQAGAATNVQHSHSTGATITLAGGGAANSGTGSYIVTGIDISVCENGTGAAAAAPIYITTTGFNGNPQYQVAGGTNNAAMLGWCSPTQTITFAQGGLRGATSGTAPTFVLPTFGSGETVSVNVYYKLGY